MILGMSETASGVRVKEIIFYFQIDNARAAS